MDLYVEVVEDGRYLGDIIINNSVSGSTLPDGHTTAVSNNSAFKLWLFHPNQGAEVWVRVAHYSNVPAVHGSRI